MEYIECPNTYKGKLPSLFIAGGITDCSDWQSQFVTKISDLNIAVLNPRRANFPINDPYAGEAQVGWEYHNLAKADAISFWFCPETLNPIVLYELGYWITSDTPIFIGTDWKYQRTKDVVFQTMLARPDLQVVYTLDALARQVRQHFS